MPESSAKHTSPERLAPADRHYIPPSLEVAEHIGNEAIRLHDCGNTTPEWRTCPFDDCSKMVLCTTCGRMIALLLPHTGGWCDLVEDERQHQLS